MVSNLFWQAYMLTGELHPFSFRVIIGRGLHSVMLLCFSVVLRPTVSFNWESLLLISLFLFHFCRETFKFSSCCRWANFRAGFLVRPMEITLSILGWCKPGLNVCLSHLTATELYSYPALSLALSVTNVSKTLPFMLHGQRHRIRWLLNISNYAENKRYN